MKILSKEEFNDFKKQQRISVETKGKRVNKLYSSIQVKNIVQQNIDNNKILSYQKITNNDYGIYKDAGKEYSNPTGKKYQRVVQDKRVFYF